MWFSSPYIVTVSWVHQSLSEFVEFIAPLFTVGAAELMFDFGSRLFFLAKFIKVIERLGKYRKIMKISNHFC